MSQANGGAAPRSAAVIGGGPAGLMAAEVLSAAGVQVSVYERMPSVARKLLIAGRGGLNLTHSEDFEAFLLRYGDAAAWLRPVLEAFPPSALVAWAEGLGQPTFVGSSGRVFPRAMKASPLLRAWLARLAGQGVVIRTRHEWRGWEKDGALVFDTPDGPVTDRPDVTILALGGASWPKLGSSAAWVPLLAQRGVEVVPFAPANMGVNIAWSNVFRERFAGQPLKNMALSAGARTVRGEAMVTRYGLEGGVIYAAGRSLRDAAALTIDLRPDATVEALGARLSRSGRSESTANRLRRAGLLPVEASLLREASGGPLPADPGVLAATIKSVTLDITGTQGLERAISSAGGIALDAVDDRLMLRAKPGVFVAGEMLDWEAPTGGYLLQACFATGVAVAKGALVFSVG